MSLRCYRLAGGRVEPAPRAEWLPIARTWMSAADRSVSTVFLGVARNAGEPPLVFETAIIGPGAFACEIVAHAASLDQAMAHHIDAVETVRAAIERPVK